MNKAMQGAIEKIAEAEKESLLHWINAVLHNDEASTDEELVDYFIQEGGISRYQALKIVEQRQRALCNMYYVVKL